MYINVDIAVSEQLLENKINENYHFAEVSAAGIDCEVLMILVKLCNKYSMLFQFRNSSYQQINGLTMGALLSGLMEKYFCRAY